jgi:hypothetical protein
MALRRAPRSQALSFSFPGSVLLDPRLLPGNALHRRLRLPNIVRTAPTSESNREAEPPRQLIPRQSLGTSNGTSRRDRHRLEFPRLLPSRSQAPAWERTAPQAPPAEHRTAPTSESNREAEPPRQPVPRQSLGTRWNDEAEPGNEPIKKLGAEQSCIRPEFLYNHFHFATCLTVPSTCES